MLNNNDNELNERRREILRLVVKAYIKNGEPVGSKALLESGGINVSSATVRNEMNLLEELGYLEKPHTSSGRVPSVKGYRFYVDTLMNPYKLNNEDLFYIDNMMPEFINAGSIDDIFKSLGRIISSATGYTAITSAPKKQDGCIIKFNMMPVNQKSVNLIALADNGKILSKLFRFKENIDYFDLEAFEKILNSKVTGIRESELDSKTFSLLMNEVAQNCKRYMSIAEYLKDMLSSLSDDKIYIDGEERLLYYPEFSDIKKARSIISYLSREKNLINNLLTSENDNTEIMIGFENEDECMSGTSLISCSYNISGIGKGKFGIIGPTRMEYSKTVSMLEYISQKLSKLLDE